MPTYAYACTACDHRFEVQQSFSDDALTECPACGARVRKVYGAVGVVFKGSGFYRNDSRQPVKSANGSARGGSGDGKDAAPKESAKESKDSSTSSSAGSNGTSGSTSSTPSTSKDAKPSTAGSAA